jgi:hypothetical protein
MRKFIAVYNTGGKILGIGNTSTEAADQALATHNVDTADIHWIVPKLKKGHIVFTYISQALFEEYKVDPNVKFKIVTDAGGRISLDLE